MPAEHNIERSKPEVRAEDVAALLPDLDSININAMDGISSLIPSVNMMEQQK
jgi:hypothetical protein